MKKIFTFCVSLLAALSVFAYDFQSGDLFYNITSSSAPYTVEVTYEEYSSDNYSGLTTATIPASVSYNGITYSVTSIGSSAFKYCSSLTSVTIPNSVTSIEHHAFYSCSSLTSVTIPNSVTSIESYAFYSCSSLTSVTIPESVTNIGYSAFESCHSLSSVILFDGLTNIDHSAFQYCSLKSIDIPSTVTTIGQNAFQMCDFTSVVIPSSVTKIEYWAFSYCPIETITVEEGNPVYDSRSNCNAIIETATNALVHGFKNTFIPSSIRSIENYAFYGCYVDSIIIPNGVESISYGAFAECTSLESITIPMSVSNVGEFAFQNCRLKKIYIKNPYPPYLGGILSDGLFSPVCYVPCGTLEDYEDSDWYSQVKRFVEEPCEEYTITYTSTDGNIVIPNKADAFGANIVSNEYKDGQGVITFDGPVTSIGEEAFRECSSLASITIPNSVTSIGKWAFTECSLTSITIPESVTSIEDYAIIACSSLTSMMVVDGNSTYDSRENCNAIIEKATNTLIAGCQKTVIPNTVTSIGNAAFARCTSLTSITIPESVTNIGMMAFRLCTSLTSVTIPNSVKTIGDEAFRECNSLTSVIIGNGVTSIEYQAFSRCTSLTSVTIPESVTSIKNNAFSGCTSLTTMVVEASNPTYDSRENCNAIVEKATNTLIAGCQNTTIPNSVTSIGEDAFYECTSLTSITIPNNVTSIRNDAFYGCTSLASINIPNSVTSIGVLAFSHCTSLTSVTLGSGVTSIGIFAFDGCSSLTSITCEATTPPTLDFSVFPSELTTAYIPCGTKEAYEASDWASQVGEFVEEGCAPIQMCGDDLYWEYADGVLTITGTGDMYDYAADTDVPWYDVRGNIKTVNLPDAMTKIGQNAFYKCTAMTSINMPTSLTAIGEKAFAQDTKLACEIILPASMTNIASRAFFNCKAVPAFHVEATTPPTVQADAFDYTTAPIHVPCGYGHVYGKHTRWGMLNLEMCELLQDNVYYYPIDGRTARAVTYHSNPTDTIVIPSAVVIDGMPRTVTEVADFAFTDCANLPAISFNEGLEYIGERAFVRCYGLQGTIVLPATLETIGERAFSYCNNVEKYLIQAMTPPALGADVFTGNNKNALFYISCEAMDDYKVATNWSSLKSRLRDACLNIYHYNTALGANGVHTTEDTLVASIYYRRQFTPYRWETLYLPFEVDRVTVLEDGEEFDLRPWNIITGGDYYLAKPDGMLNLEILFDFTDELEAHTPYIIQFVYDYYRGKIITFYGKESWNKLSTSFEVLSSSAWMQIAGNTTLQDQLLEKPVYMLRSGLDFILQKTTTTLHPFECYVMPYATSSGEPARMNVRFRGDVPTAVESVKGSESHLTYTVDGYTLTVYPQGQAFSIYSLNGALIYSCEAGKEAVDCELNSGCYLLHAGTEAHKIML